jgi:hypothetical protein
VNVRSIVPSLPRSSAQVAVPMPLDELTVTVMRFSGSVIVHSPDSGVPSAA